MGSSRVVMGSNLSSRSAQNKVVMGSCKVVMGSLGQVAMASLGQVAMASLVMSSSRVVMGSNLSDLSSLSAHSALNAQSIIGP